ncbi:MAG TPA: hypothetical protein DER60_07325 [Syntrophomonas sp.]|jgi:adenine deaminase|nr:hypothetical protein [Syntrophomonas sp.]
MPVSKDFEKMRLTALGQAAADVLLINGQVLSVFNGELRQANVAICGSHIAGVGDYQEGRQVIDLKGRYILPGFIDSHIHIESTMLTPASFAYATAPWNYCSSGRSA